MKIQNIFERDIFRPINGVVKADQLDDSSVWQELDEFVVTREIDQHLRKFFSAYGDALSNKNDPEVMASIGVWISGFFGSGKSHFIKVLSYLLRNGTHSHDGDSKKAVEFFENKIKDAMLLGDIKRAVASNTEVILFNIDSKADQSAVEKVTIAGKYCESGDLLASDIMLPKMEAGDLIAIPAAGAYCPSMASNYNLNPRPPMVLVNDGQSRLIRRRESYQDLMHVDVG